MTIIHVRLSLKKLGMQWWIQRGIPGCTGTPLWAAPSTILVRLNGTPLFGYRTKKTAAMAHLRMLY